MAYEIRNALIKSATITSDDHGMLSAWLDLDYGDCGQGFGGYALYVPGKSPDVTGRFIWRVLEVAGVGRWDLLPGTAIRVRGDSVQIDAIGHILNNVWFEPRKELKDDATD